MMQLFLFLFFYCLSLSADQIDLNKSKIDQAKEQQHIFGYRECCGNNLFWCKNGLFQFSTLGTSFSLIWIGVNLLGANQRAAGGEIILRQAVPFLKCVLIATCSLLFPYLARYSSSGHLKPTCYKTAFFTPGFFIEVPYFFYQNRKNKKLDIHL